jgi:hypothetical protein
MRGLASYLVLNLEIIGADESDNHKPTKMIILMTFTLQTVNYGISQRSKQISTITSMFLDDTRFAPLTVIS